MEAEHHHALNMGLSAGAFNMARCLRGFSAQIRPKWAKNAIVA